MRLESLTLRDFRNYQRAEITLCPTLNLFVGRNAQGKTNLLEAVYLLAIGKSFRSSNEREMTRYGAAAFKVTGTFTGDDGVKLLIEYTAAPGDKTIRQNGLPLKKAQDLFGQVRVVLFSPDDLQLLKGGPEYRRAYLDLYLAQTNAQYRYSIYNLHRLLAQRNEELRRIRDGLAGRDALAVWNDALVKRASEVTRQRVDALAVLAPMVSRHHLNLAGGSEEIRLEYLLGGHRAVAHGMILDDYFLSELAAREREEIGRGLTVVGPHRDDLSIVFGSGHDLRSFGSQGQQRTAALAMKLAAMDFLHETTGEQPILLLDDVLSEFDDHRKRALLGILVETRQTLITATERKDFDPYGNRPRFFQVSEGRLEA